MPPTPLKSRWMLALLVLLPLSPTQACTSQPDPCDEMCDAAGSLYASCLDDWGLDFPAAGYDDQTDFIDRCQTWAWEARLLEQDAGQTGDTNATCSRRAQSFTDAQADTAAPECTAYTDIEWEVMPWDATP